MAWGGRRVSTALALIALGAAGAGGAGLALRGCGADPPHRPIVLSTFGVSFTVAPGESEVVGPADGQLLRYQVAVEQGLTESPADVAATVEAVLGDQRRGWLRSGTWRFQRVSSGPYDFVVELASAATTDHICGEYGIQTEGQVSCRGQQNVVINEVRWARGTNGTTEGAVRYAPADYRILVINHEVGHALGFDHVRCPGAGRPAPVMMAQYYGVEGCTPNVWPYAADGTHLTGPPA